MPAINIQEAIDIEVISNGLIARQKGQEATHFAGIAELLDYATHILRDQVREARHLEWAGKFTLKITAYDAPPEVLSA